MKENMKIYQVPELIAYCYFDGKIDQGSTFEVEMKMNSNIITKANVTRAESNLLQYFYSFSANNIYLIKCV